MVYGFQLFQPLQIILKLTPQSQYGINIAKLAKMSSHFEVDSTESVWYNYCDGDCDWRKILKLTPQSQYGIPHPPSHAPAT